MSGGGRAAPGFWRWRDQGDARLRGARARNSCLRQPGGWLSKRQAIERAHAGIVVAGRHVGSSPQIATPPPVQGVTGGRDLTWRQRQWTRRRLRSASCLGRWRRCGRLASAGGLGLVGFGLVASAPSASGLCGGGFRLFAASASAKRGPAWRLLSWRAPGLPQGGFGLGSALVLADFWSLRGAAEPCRPRPSASLAWLLGLARLPALVGLGSCRRSLGLLYRPPASRSLGSFSASARRAVSLRRRRSSASPGLWLPRWALGLLGLDAGSPGLLPWCGPRPLSASMRAISALLARFPASAPRMRGLGLLGLDAGDPVGAGPRPSSVFDAGDPGFEGWPSASARCGGPSECGRRSRRAALVLLRRVGGEFGVAPGPCRGLAASQSSAAFAAPV